MLEQLGYTFAGGDWHAPAGMAAPASTSIQADAMHALLVQREAYETLRWPNGKVDGGKG